MSTIGGLTADLLLDIFSRLPVKTIIRVGSVCKSWKGLISFPVLIDLHLKSADKKPMKILYCFISGDPELGAETTSRITVYDGATLSRVAGFTTEHMKLRSENIVGVLNGVICTESVESGIAILWNPSIHKYVTVRIGDWDSGETILGFGFCSSNHDFKLIRIGYSKNDLKLSSNYEVFSINEWKWKKGVIADNVVTHFRDLVSVRGRPRWGFWFGNGKLHWLGLGCRVLVFDCEREEFSTMEPPSAAFDGMDIFEESMCLSDLKSRLFSCMSSYSGEDLIAIEQEDQYPRVVIDKHTP